MRKNDKYSKGRRALLITSICLTAVFLPLVLFGPLSIDILGFVALFWVVYFMAKDSADKNYEQAKLQYKGDLVRALRECTDCNDEYAILDQGIYSYVTNKLSRFENITLMEPKYTETHSKDQGTHMDTVRVTIEMIIYENGVRTSGIYFDTKRELEDFVYRIAELTNNRFPIKGVEYGSTQRDLDDISRKIFGDVKMTPSKQADDPTKDSVDKDKVIF